MLKAVKVLQLMCEHLDLTHILDKIKGALHSHEAIFQNNRN